ncbi:hypothetical protein RYX36_034248 [Vicia faba]
MLIQYLFRNLLVVVDIIHMQDTYVLNFPLVLHLMRVLVKWYNNYRRGLSVVFLFIQVDIISQLIICLVEFEKQCYCYVCDSIALCKFWTRSSDKLDLPRHCDANSDWEEQRNGYKRLSEEKAR